MLEPIERYVEQTVLKGLFLAFTASFLGGITSGILYSYFIRHELTRHLKRD